MGINFIISCAAMFILFLIWYQGGIIEWVLNRALQYHSDMNVKFLIYLFIFFDLVS